MTQISLLALIIMIIIHFFGDFVLQTHWQAVNKSTNNEALTNHVTTYALCWLLPMMGLFYLSSRFNIFGDISLAIVFTVITYITHWGIDYCTSRINSKLWANGNIHNFFVGIGFDAVLHYIQLFSTFYLLNNI